MTESMIEWRLFTGLTVAAFFFFSSGFCDLKKENDSQDPFAGTSGSAAFQEALLPAYVDSMDTIPMPDHGYLNNVEWELRQPRDLSMASVTTTANSTADRVHFVYNCGKTEKKSTAIPTEGTVTDSVHWNCDNIITTHMVAVGTDTTVEYSYQINMPFLNNLDP